MAIFNTVITVLEIVWQISTALLPVTLLGFVGWGLYRHGNDFSAVLGFAFDDVMPRSGEYVVFGFTVTGIIGLMNVEQWIVTGLGVAAILLFLYREAGSIESTGPASDIRAAAYIGITAVAAAALLVQAGVLPYTVFPHLAATLFYAVLFWEV